MITGKQYAEQAWYYYNLVPKTGYIYGCSADAKVWTAANQKAIEEKYARTGNKDLEMSAKYGSKWIGHVVLDCSGLTCKCGKNLGLSYHHGSNSSYNYDCQAKGAKTQNMKLPVGAWVYTGTTKNRGHIGIVADADSVIECQGTKAGITKSKLTLSKWTWWGLGKGITFDFIPGIDPTPTPTPEPIPTPTQRPTLRHGSTGAYVRELQNRLNQNGNKLVVDGIFGGQTESAVREYQKRKGLVVDGIVGPKTWAKLLG